ncbi:MAG: DUF934 domain-containing protein [Alphaproteobacteria bacterium]|nr:DUF934 domain-containing protein [Alphaproteobacteria bacterium]
MPLLNRTGAIADSWQRLDEAAPATGREAFLPLTRLDQEGGAVLAAGGKLGVAISGDTELNVLKPWLGRLSLIAISFPSFTDGRGFSLARQLRLRGFKGELRASGYLIADQFGFALAAGFDTVEIDDALAARQPIADWLAAAESISLSYQRDYAGPRNILEARRAARTTPQSRVTQTEPAK